MLIPGFAAHCKVIGRPSRPPRPPPTAMPELPSSVPKMLAALARMDLPNWELNMRLAALRGDPKAQEWLDIVTQAGRDRDREERERKYSGDIVTQASRDRDREERERKYSDDERDRGRRSQKGHSIQQRAEQHRGRDFQERERKYSDDERDRGRRSQKGQSIQHRDPERRIPSRSRSRSYISQTIHDRRREDLALQPVPRQEDPVPHQEDPAFGLVLGPIPEPLGEIPETQGYDQDLAWCRIKGCNNSQWPVNHKGAWTFCKAHKHIVHNLPQDHPVTRQLLLESST